jgi:hypothetical protein
MMYTALMIVVSGSGCRVWQSICPAATDSQTPTNFDHGGWSAAADRIAIPLVEKTGNLWMMTRSEAR